MPPQAADQHGGAFESLCADLAATRHVIVASNRGPISFTDDGSEHPAASSSNAGALSTLIDKLPLTWVSVAASGADRAAAEAADDGLITRGVPAGWTARLVSPSRRAFHRYYNVVCNPLLWFLHHRSWGFTHTPNIDREAHTSWQQGFVAVSRMMAAEIASEAERVGRQTAVLLRDYHMHAVGRYVRDLLPDATIHYAPGVPWPGPSDWMMLPLRWRTEIFSSLLACDVIDMSSGQDVRALMACFEEFVPGVSIDRDAQVVTGGDGKKLQISSHPPAVDGDGLAAATNSSRTRRYLERFSADTRFTYVTAERAEPYKNIVRCIRAYGLMLEQDRSLAGETRYLLVLAPPPPHLSQYRRYLSEIKSAVRDVNSQHGSKAGNPVELMIENNYPAALAAMTIADALVSVPIADASCTTLLSTPLINESDCTLITSDTNAAAEVFQDAARLVGPTDVVAIRDEMLCALEMSEQERVDRFASAQLIASDRTERSLVESQLRRLLSAATGN